jgi:hypothetical protein
MMYQFHLLVSRNQGSLMRDWKHKTVETDKTVRRSSMNDKTVMFSESVALRLLLFAIFLIFSALRLVMQERQNIILGMRRKFLLITRWFFIFIPRFFLTFILGGFSFPSFVFSSHRNSQVSPCQSVFPSCLASHSLDRQIFTSWFTIHKVEPQSWLLYTSWFDTSSWIFLFAWLQKKCFTFYWLGVRQKFSIESSR